MSETSDRRSEEFLRISPQFQLGDLVTESSHPVTADLSAVAARDTAEALDRLFRVDEDVVAKYPRICRVGQGGGDREDPFAFAPSRGQDFFHRLRLDRAAQRPVGFHLARLLATAPRRRTGLFALDRRMGIPDDAA